MACLWRQGFGYVEFESAEARDEAVARLDGSEMLGRPIVVAVSRPTSTPSDRGGGRRGGGRGDRGRGGQGGRGGLGARGREHGGRDRGGGGGRGFGGGRGDGGRGRGRARSLNPEDRENPERPRLLFPLPSAFVPRSVAAARLGQQGGTGEAPKSNAEFRSLLNKPK